MNHYPITIASDTGELSDIPRKTLDLVKSQPVISGAVIGATAGHFLFKKHALLGAVIGVVGGYYVRSKG